jgi:hypothetical protein
LYVYYRCLSAVTAAVDISNIDVLCKIAKSVGVTGAREYLQSKRDEVSTAAMYSFLLYVSEVASDAQAVQ